jgi:hypothetical protein
LYKEKEKSNGNNTNAKDENNLSTLEQILDDDFIIGKIPSENLHKNVNNYNSANLNYEINVRNLNSSFNNGNNKK